MKKCIVLIGLVVLTFTGFSQNPKTYTNFLSRITQQKKSHLSEFNNNFPEYRFQNNGTKQKPHLKEADALKQRLDSVVAPESDKEEYLYDAFGNLLLDTYYEWDGSKWINYWKYEFIYDDFGNNTKYFSYEWDGTKWLNNLKEEKTFDSNGNVRVYINSTWDPDLGNWHTDRKQEFKYDSNNNLIQDSTSYYDSDANMYLLWYKNEFVYDSIGNPIQITASIWDSNSNIWIDFDKQESEYDSNGNRTLSYIYYWDEIENWKYSEKLEAVIDNTGNITEIVGYYWELDDWVKGYKLNYNFDNNGNLTTTLASIFDGEDWISYFKYESVFDEFGNRIKQTYFELDFEGEDFVLVPIEKEEYVYDNNFTFENLMLPFKVEDFESDYEDESIFDLRLMFNHKLTQITYSESDGGEFYIWGNYTLYYSEQNTTSISNFDLTKNLSVYPNPATNQITFTIDAPVDQMKIDVFNIHGKLMMSKISANNAPISIESLNSGLYFYRLEENQNFSTGKFMVK